MNAPQVPFVPLYTFYCFLSKFTGELRRKVPYENECEFSRELMISANGKKKEFDKISAYRKLKSGRADLRRWQI